MQLVGTHTGQAHRMGIHVYGYVHVKIVVMAMDMDVKFHIHSKPAAFSSRPNVGAVCM